MAENSKRDFYWLVFNTLITAIAAPAILLFVQHSVQSNEAKINLQLDEMKTAMQDEENDRNYGLKVFEMVQASLISGDTRQQQVAKALVLSLDEKSKLRESLLNVMSNSKVVDTVIREEIGHIVVAEKNLSEDDRAISNTAIPVAVTATPSKGYNSIVIQNNKDGWDYDIFWCETSGDNVNQQAIDFAQKIKNTYKEKAGRIRIRKLPATINTRSGYQVSGYIIRANAGEDEQAKDLAGLGKPDLPFEIQPSSQITKYYLSAFICPFN
jgi:hypothetical protein